MNYFIGCTCLQELKTKYHELAFLHHPDRGGQVETMQLINSQYKIEFLNLKNRKPKNDEDLNAVHDNISKEVPMEFIEIISKLIFCNGLIIEIIGGFIWLSGDTKTHKETIKEVRAKNSDGETERKFIWHKKKLNWYLSYEGYRKYNNKTWEMDEIRSKFGSQTVSTQNQNQMVRVN